MMSEYDDLEMSRVNVLCDHDANDPDIATLKIMTLLHNRERSGSSSSKACS